MVIILGDFNACIGSNFVLHGSVIGPHGLGECNEIKERLFDFCMSNQLPHYQHKVSEQATPSGNLVLQW